MNGGLSRPFIKFPIATSLIMVGILFVGLVAYENLPVAPLPKVDFPTIQVSALLPGRALRRWPRRWPSRSSASSHRSQA